MVLKHNQLGLVNNWGCNQGIQLQLGIWDLILPNGMTSLILIPE